MARHVTPAGGVPVVPVAARPGAQPGQLDSLVDRYLLRRRSG
ncbi:hypothetical protein [Plantactinospora sp. KLBMP9567]|nr:hypothetical protein [Plantactinospora sp. KLBMP9567]MDW5328644.1 hypothetical protein [Plantactinospora sp. KLBMP9567]